MLTLSAQWIVPITGRPIRHGFVTVDSDGRIQTVGEGSPAPATSLGNVALMPSLVNAHTHIELSFLHGRVPPSSSFNEWVTTMMAIRRESAPDRTASAIVDAAQRAVTRARATGTGLIGDVSNTLTSVGVLRDASLPAHVFHELLGFNLIDAPGRVAQARTAIENWDVDPDRVRISLAPHAPYSVSPALFQAIRHDVNAHRHPVTSVHLGESAQEIELLRDGTGPARSMLERLGVWTDAWKPPGVSPVVYLMDLGFLDAHTLVVHGVQFERDDLARLRTIGATVVSCPRSNAYVGVGPPPLEAFYEAGVDIAFGTDSLASVADLNMFNELAEARRVAPDVAAQRLLESATLIGARALGFGSELGSIEAGKRASLLAVRVPEGVLDVEEYLVAGVEPDAIMWLDSTTRLIHTRE